MAEQTKTQDQVESRETDGGSSGNGGHKAVRAAALAAATGAAAIAARKALSGRDQSGEERSQSRSGGGDESMLVAMATSGWSAAKDSLLPFAEDAAGAAGDWIGRNGPDYVCEKIVPRFIDGFENARGSSGDAE